MKKFFKYELRKRERKRHDFDIHFSIIKEIEI